MPIIQFSIVIFILTIMFLFFVNTKNSPNTGVWIILIILFTIVLGMTTTSVDYDQERINPTYLIGEYS